jgi:hypothetical protein
MMSTKKLYHVEACWRTIIGGLLVFLVSVSPFNLLLPVIINCSVMYTNIFHMFVLIIQLQHGLEPRSLVRLRHLF